LVVLLLFAGDEIATVEATPLTVRVTGELEPNELVQTTVMVFGPALSGTELLAGVGLLAPFKVQLVPGARVDEPSTV